MQGEVRTMEMVLKEKFARVQPESGMKNSCERKRGWRRPDAE